MNRSLDLLREDVARRQREAAYSAQTWQETNQWEDIAPAVDEALEDLQPEERDLLIRHFLQGQSMVQIAAAEGISQPTVSRRVAAALERLRDELRRRGVLVGLAALGGMLPLTAVAAPELLLHGLGNMVLGQAASVSAAAAAGAGAGGFAAKLGSVSGRSGCRQPQAQIRGVGHRRRSRDRCGHRSSDRPDPEPIICAIGHPAGSS